MNDMVRKVLDQLTANLSMGGSQTDVLTNWFQDHGQGILDAARDVVTAPFGWAELGELAERVSQAVESLGEQFDGRTQAQVAQMILVAVVRAVLPDNVEHWVIPLLNGEAVAALIEAAFRKWSGDGDGGNAAPADGGAAPTTFDSTLPPAGIVEGKE